jgi:hypothetical protein
MKTGVPAFSVRVREDSAAPLSLALDTPKSQSLQMRRAAGSFTSTFCG